MEKEFIPYQTALDLKELGFDKPCFASYYHAGKKLDIAEYVKHGEYTVLVPLFQQAFRWFREKYGLHSEILLDQTTQPKYCFEIHKYEDFGNYEEIKIDEWFLYRTYEEAELACLVGLIEIVKNSK